jgi:hypothetical protein
VGLDLGLCLQGHTKWVGDFSTLVGVYKDDNRIYQLAHLLMHHCSYVPSLEEYLAHMLRQSPILLVDEGPPFFMELVKH